MKFNDIDKAIEFVTSLKNTGHLFDDFKRMCNKLGNPQNKIKTIHITGTNGKGSCVNYLKDLLMSCGFKVGTYTSPHYITHLDRIRINDNNIDETSFLRLLNKYYDLYKDVNLSMFEYDYLIMCDYFIENKVDYAIVEVGIGGRLDYTNVIDNTLLSVITTIGYDHMEKLGNSLVDICKEKCGIIKNNSNVVIGELEDSLYETVVEKCIETGSVLHRIKDVDYSKDREIIFNNKSYKISSYAKYQLHNASLALLCFDVLSDLEGFNIDYEKAYLALKNSNWRARFEIVSENPRIILDGAHNIHGINSLMDSFDQFKGSKCVVFSALKRKEYLKMIDIVKSHCDKLIITTFDSNEVIDLKEFKDVDIYTDYIKAIDYAKSNYDNVLICGSLYFMSDVAINYKFN